MEDNYDISALKKKKKVNSRAKGSTFERQIANTLNDRFNTSEFSRTPGSGAFATTHSLPEHLKIYGDLITPEKFKYCIECKKGYNKQAVASLFNNRSDFWVFMKKCEKDARACKKLPMLIFKQDRQPTLVVVKDELPIKEVKVKQGPTNCIRIKDYRIYLFDELLKGWKMDDWCE